MLLFIKVFRLLMKRIIIISIKITKQYRQQHNQNHDISNYVNGDESYVPHFMESFITIIYTF